MVDELEARAQRAARCALTFVRTTELIGARWEEFDLKAARWDMPAECMKMKTPHIVPLSVQAVNVLKTLHLITGHGAMLFPSERDEEKSMGNNTILKALERMGHKGRMTGHGFRGVASTLLHEMGFNHAHIELQLAHQEPPGTLHEERRIRLICMVQLTSAGIANTDSSRNL
ncbi:hypothetical protein BH11PSE7_BH11PSE7_30210 [soil metagenome]